MKRTIICLDLLAGLGVFLSAVHSVKAQTSADALIYQPAVPSTIKRSVADKLVETLSVRDFGAKGDGIADDTAAIQAGLNYFSAPNNHSGKILVPQGTYKITASLFYQGNPSTGLTLECEEGGTRGPSGTKLAWYGPADTPVVWLLGANEALIEGCEIEGVNAMLTGIWIDATNTTPPGSAAVAGVTRSNNTVTVQTQSAHPFVAGSTISLSGISDHTFNVAAAKVLAVTGSTSFSFSQGGGDASSSGGTARQIVSAGSSGVTLERITVSGPAGPNSAAVRISHLLPTDRGTNQVSEIYIKKSILVGNYAARTSAYGISVDNAGNTKNVFVEDTGLTGFEYGVGTTASGSFTMTNCTFHNFVADIRTGTGVTTLFGGESESVAKFVTGTTGSNAGTVAAFGFSWEGKAPDESDVIADFAGNYVFVGCRFFNLRDYPHSVPKIRVGDPSHAGNNNSGIYSIGNYYQAAGPYAPFVGANPATLLLDPAGPSSNSQFLNVTSINDSGGVGGAMLKLPSVTFLNELNVGSLRMQKAQTPASSNAACSAGQMMWDASYLYVCAAAGPDGKALWKRAALGTF